MKLYCVLVKTEACTHSLIMGRLHIIMVCLFLRETPQVTDTLY